MKSTESDMAQLSAVQSPNYTLHTLESKDEANPGCYVIMFIASAHSGEQNAEADVRSIHNVPHDAFLSSEHVLLVG